MKSPKKIAEMIVLGADKKPDDAPAAEKEPAGDESGESDAMREFMGAMDKGDDAGAAKALKTFIEICYPELGKSEAEEPDSGLEG